MLKKEILKIIFVLSLYTTAISAQQALPAAGGDGTGSGGSVSFTMGQILYTTNSSSGNISEAQGVQQPYEISIITEIENRPDIRLKCKVYPNPSIGQLTLEIDRYTGKAYHFVLYDIAGKLLQHKKVVDAVTLISIEKYVPATYLLQVMEEDETIQTFKIIKAEN
jgi:hypothetical protein